MTFIDPELGKGCRSWPTWSGCAFSVYHCPPGTSKWHKIEHRMFCHSTEDPWS